jgi:hypothetical protein
MKKLPDIAKEPKTIAAPHGFVRKSSTWRRDNGWCIDIIEFQLAKSRDTFSINLGVLVKSVYSLVWGDIPASPGSHHGTVRSRTGWQREGEADAEISWEVDDEAWMQDAIGPIQNVAFPFFDRMHTRGMG